MDFFINNLKTIITVISVAVLAILGIKYYQKIKKFLLEVRLELSKVSWSTRDELISSTFVVIVVTIIMAIFIGLVDFSLSRMLSLVFR